MPATPTVFISYSHRDEAWKDLLVPQLRALEQAGVGLQVWHDRKIDGDDQWYPEIREAMTMRRGPGSSSPPTFSRRRFACRRKCRRC